MVVLALNHVLHRNSQKETRLKKETRIDTANLKDLPCFRAHKLRT